MTMARVKCLHLKLSDADAAAKSQFLVEEALRLSSEDGGERLVVLRKLDLGRIDQDLNARTSALLRGMIANAVSASSESSIRAKAVYFESTASAQGSLLELLLRDIEPMAWFWAKAVPVWKRGESGSVLRLLISLNQSPQSRIILAQTLLRVIQSGALPALLQKVSEADAVQMLNVWPGKALALGEFVPSVSHKSVSHLRPRQPLPSLRMPNILSDVFTGSNLQHVLSMPMSSAVRQWLVVTLVPAAMRHLADDAHAAVDFARRIEAELTVQPRSSQQLENASVAVFARKSEQSRLRPPSSLLSHSTSIEGDAKPVSVPITIEKPDLISEQRSVAAGIFYLVRPLKLMGYGNWLKAHPHEAELQHGLHLLRDIAVRQRVFATDPIWQILPSESEPSLDVSPWRIGLDRLLRKRCRMNLAQVVKRVGWLDIGLEHITVRFALEAADVRLRRQGFDFDSGFVPWLGRSLSFKYRDN